MILFLLCVILIKKLFFPEVTLWGCLVAFADKIIYGTIGILVLLWIIKCLV